MQPSSSIYGTQVVTPTHILFSSVQRRGIEFAIDTRRYQAAEAAEV